MHGTAVEIIYNEPYKQHYQTREHGKKHMFMTKKRNVMDLTTKAAH
jgi:hypothetical protein